MIAATVQDGARTDMARAAAAFLAALDARQRGAALMPFRDEERLN